MQKRHAVAAVCLVTMLALTAAMCVAIWKTTSSDDSEPAIIAAIKQVNLSDTVFIEISGDQVDLNYREVAQDNSTSFTSRAFLAKGVNNSEMTVTDAWASNGNLEFKWKDGSIMIMRNFPPTDFTMSCVNVRWKMSNGSQETPKDCFDMVNSSWFGGFEEAFQPWPINKANISTAPFVTGDGYISHNIGDLIEGLFVSSTGIGIYVYPNSSLYISVNENGSQLLCINGKIGRDTPFVNTHKEPVQTYDICQAPDITELWKRMAKKYLSSPKGTPSPDVLRYPIWSTWARYKGCINQTTVLEFAHEIKTNSFGISQLELDDNWTPKYGDFTFSKDKFPDAKAMITTLTDLGIPLTVWVHPFFNRDSTAFGELENAGFLVKATPSSKAPALTAWWRGPDAGILDVTNTGAVKWYLNKLKLLLEDYNVTSFKFDGGESNWLPNKYHTENPMTSPNNYSHLYAQMAFEADMSRRQEIRTGFQNQNLPLLVRMIDRESNWGHNRGLKTLIPCALTMSLMGYPFVLPDMVGGNAYDPSDLDKTVLPDPELFIRWLQVTALMPSIQFSIPPWFYNNTVVKISKKFTSLHESFAEKIIALAENVEVKGDPILRPIWWLAPEDEEALQIETEFMLGDDVLVAPVLERGAVRRDIYLPKGRWRDYSHGTYKEYTGPVWVKDFPAGLDVLPYFVKVHF